MTPRQAVCAMSSINGSTMGVAAFGPHPAKRRAQARPRILLGVAVGHPPAHRQKQDTLRHHQFSG